MRLSLIRCDDYLPCDTNHGVESICASAIPVIKLVAPGPEVAIATPTSPEILHILVRHVLLLAHDAQDMVNLS